MEVERRPVEVPGRRGHPTDPVPPLQHANHRLLREFLGFSPVSGQQEERPAEPLVLLGEEPLEGAVEFGAVREIHHRFRSEHTS